MTRDDAHRLLDEARAGGAIPPEEITRALCATGDLEADTWPIVQTRLPAGSWERTAAPDMLAPATPFDGLIS